MLYLLRPSGKFVEGLPYKRIPDRRDFIKFRKRDNERMEYWNKVIEENKKLGFEFRESIESGKIKKIVRPIDTNIKS